MSGEKELTVRRAVSADIPALMRLLVQVNMVHAAGRPDLFRGPTTKYTEEELAALLTDEKRPIFVCADGEGRVLGHGFCVIEEPENTRLMTDVRTLYVDDICVDEGARGRSVGTALFRHIEAYAAQAGCSRVTLNVWTCNPGAMKFYEKMGLVPYKIGMEKIL